MKILELLQLFLTLGVIVGPLPNAIANGQTEDAVPVMANYNWILNQVNANAAPLNNPTFTGVVTAVTGAFTSITASGTLTVSTANAGGLTQEAVTAPTLLNSWVNYGSGFQPVGFWKDSEGVVHIQGMIKSGTTTAATPFFVLPAGYRPQNYQIFACESASAYSGVGVNDSNGSVEARAGCSATYQCLNGISFRADH